jgi:hypothetical protein
MRSVTILLTTRLTELPANLHPERINVLPLDEKAAQETFARNFGVDVCPPEVKKLLSDLQFHPLSINLLAQAAVQNNWRPKILVQKWEKRLTSLLDGLKASIDFSLNSPSIQNLEHGRHFLLTVAILPQGVDERKLKELFPAIDGVDVLYETLCRHSLLYLDDTSITMLAPIRLYLTNNNTLDPRSIPLFADIRAYYYSQLTKFANIEPGEPDFEGGDWIITEDINVERLITLDLHTHENMETCSRACVHFIKHLIRHKSRPTALRPLVLAVEKLPRTSQISSKNFACIFNPPTGKPIRWYPKEPVFKCWPS